MDSLLTGSDKLLEIKTAQIDLVLKSKTKFKLPTAANDFDASSVKIMGFDIDSISIPALGITENYSGVCGCSVHELSTPALFFEQTDYVLTAKSRTGKEIGFFCNSDLIAGKVGHVFDDDPTVLSGILNYRNDVGFSDLTITDADGTVLRITIEVFPSKISYREDYREMMTDINNTVAESMLDFMKKTYGVFVPNHERNDAPAVFFTILQTVYEKFAQSAKRLLKTPYHKLVTEYSVEPYYKACRVNSKSEKWLEKHSEYAEIESGMVFANKILSSKKMITFDTQENRLVKFMLKAVEDKVRDFLLRYEKTSRDPDTNIATEANRMAEELKRLYSTTFLSGVSDCTGIKSMSLVFEMAPGYREFYKYYLVLRNGLTLNGDVFHMSERETSVLYEYWCFIKLYSILKEAKSQSDRQKYLLVSSDIVKADRKGITVDLSKGKTSNIVFSNTETGEKITLSYNPSESKTQTVNQRPDNVLQLEKKGSNTDYKYVFDAKYRIEFNTDSEFYPDMEPGPKVDDINTMHRYRDSIVYENVGSRFTFEKTMFGAYVLFPYKDEERYRNHRFFKSIETVNIGGLPFLPSATGLVSDLLDSLISDSSESAFERASLPAGAEERLSTVDWSKRDVLIGLVADKPSLELCLKRKTYSVYGFGQNHLPIRYVALYEKGLGIRFYGETVSWDVIPPSSDENQSKRKLNVFRVLKWSKLPSPVKQDSGQPNPIAYTNLFLLTSCANFSELRIESEEGYRLYRELNRADEAKTVCGEDTETFKYGKAVISVGREDISVVQDGNLVYSVSRNNFLRKPGTVVRTILCRING